jgi:transposase-like protein
MKRRHRRHSTSLKLELARAYLNGEGSFKAIAKRHDISHALLMTWVEKYRKGELTDEIRDDERIREYEARIASLERKVGQLVMELDLVKKREVIPNSDATPLIDSEQSDLVSGKGVLL